MLTVCDQAILDYFVNDLCLDRKQSLPRLLVFPLLTGWQSNSPSVVRDCLTKCNQKSVE